jgi:hypothetical protein
MADHVSACATVLTPLYELIKAHAFAAERVDGDDTTLLMLAKVKTRTGQIWTYVRDDRPSAIRTVRAEAGSGRRPHNRQARGRAPLLALDVIPRLMYGCPFIQQPKQGDDNS